MKQKYLLIVALAASLLLSGCVSVLPGLVEAWFTVAGVEITGPTMPMEDLTLSPEEAQVVGRVSEQAAQDQQVDVDDVEIISVEREEWTDSCLGLGGPAEICAFVITPGYRVVVEVNGEEFAYRTDLTADVIRAEVEMAMDDEPAVAAVREQAAQDHGVDADAVEIISVETVEWPDACLGLAGPDEMCAQVITPGYRVVVAVDGEEYAYRTDLSGAVIRAEDGMAGNGSAEVEPAMVVRQMLMQQLHANFDEIEIVAVEENEWPGGCLGLAAENEACTLAIVFGYRIVLAVNGDEYVFRTNQDASVIRLESAPEAQIGETVVEWRAPADQLCTVAQIGTEGVAFGLCGGPLMGGHFGMPERMDDLEEFRSAFASFEVDTPAGHVIFSGEGDEEVTAAQQRMIAEWAQLARLEAEAGRSGASWGLVFAWHREGGIAGFCDDLTVYVTGIASASSCAAQQPEDLGRVRLDAEQLEQIFGWVDSLAPFEYEQTDPAVADAMTIRIVFSGAGDEEATDEQIAEIENFAGLLFAEIEQ
ncbi:MAG: hypothetical protein KF893_00380 [Caldilineaceae bacterium]|nr:hypothetical protein [Caldilineaceae bacterium]